MTNATNFVFLGTPGDDVIDEQFEPLLKGNDILEGDDGNDLLKGFGGQDQIKGEVGDDTLYGGAKRDSLFGGVGDDDIYGGSGNDLIEGGANDDYIYGGTGNDYIYGDNAGPIPPSPSDPFFVEGNDYIYAGSGNDTVKGQGGNDTIYGEQGRDKLIGGKGDDYIDGGVGNDTIKGNLGDDKLLGDSGRDLIYGGGGNDTIKGGAGSDTLSGGKGYDVFVFDPSTDFKNFNYDVITDFDVNRDRIDLTAFALNVDGSTNFAYDEFEFGLTQGLQSALFQVGADVYIGSRPVLGGNYGSLSGTGNVGNGLNDSFVILENVNVGDLGNANFIFPGETPAH